MEEYQQQIVRVFFAWFDCWIGLYWSRKHRILYICPFPTVVIAVSADQIFYNLEDFIGSLVAPGVDV